VSFSFRLKELMKREGRDKHSLARATNIHVATIYNYMNDVNEPNVSKLKIICGALNTTPNELMGFKGHIYCPTCGTEEMLCGYNGVGCTKKMEA
jgi:transcriptional regulator with XRE-family HTH domain